MSRTASHMLATPITTWDKLIYHVDGTSRGSHGTVSYRTSNAYFSFGTPPVVKCPQISRNINVRSCLGYSPTRGLVTLLLEAYIVNYITYVRTVGSKMESRKHSRGETAEKAGGNQTSDNYDVTSYARTSAAAPSATRELNGSREADAVVGAAVRGGSLLMLLALLQVRQAR